MQELTRQTNYNKLIAFPTNVSHNKIINIFQLGYKLKTKRHIWMYTVIAISSIKKLN